MKIFNKLIHAEKGILHSKYLMRAELVFSKSRPLNYFCFQNRFIQTLKALSDDETAEHSSPVQRKIDDKFDFVLADHVPISYDDPKYIQYSPEFLASKYVQSKKNIVLWPDFISDAEQNMLVESIEKKLRRYCRDGYAMGHFDNRITNYREFSYSAWLPRNRAFGKNQFAKDQKEIGI
ncbi:hypothetical protein AYI68_g4309 [Smittium mucronatum]|uniref:Uncharacterized protein n=1 Tax=Smittium mucronatum TaxID=133383 RepID=A0A1R0GXG4_9FUNG|nr:hypothetical protein AYI68_g4309 [Smittium mucronatum]